MPASRDRSSQGQERSKRLKCKKANCEKGEDWSKSGNSVQAVPPKKISVVKVVQSRVKPGPQSMLEIELALAKPVGISIFLLSRCTGPRDEGLTTTNVGERTAHVVAFDNLGDDSSPDVRGTPSCKRLDKNVRLQRRQYLVSFYVATSPCYCRL
jgi:hypothetical protein